VLGLVASYAVLALLLLSLNLKSAWHWRVKAAAIALTAGFFVVAFVALEALLGWPTEAPPPAQFQLHAALVLEPDRGARSAGAIYLWLSPRDAQGNVTGPLRAHALPYSRALHEQTARAQARLNDGRPVEGTAEPAPPRDYPSTQVRLFDAPGPVLRPRPAKRARPRGLAPAPGPGPRRSGAATRRCRAA
jgi:hypothetical protein